MPRFDKTGPEGKGPRTGRGLGVCAPDEKTDATNPKLPTRGIGRGLGRGVGRGLGRPRVQNRQGNK